MAKRVFDVTITLLVAPVAALVTAIMAVALAIELRGNPFFVQQRVGLNGRAFRIYKLRTMRRPMPGEEPGYVVDDWSTFVFSPSGVTDSRLTRLGAVARRTSLDELPNLINVFLGDMSLVGPRPELPEIVAQYPDRYRRRHDVRPGIAGLAQVNGRSDLTYDEIASYDLRYVGSHSVLTDIHILWKSLAIVLAGSGAR